MAFNLIITAPFSFSINVSSGHLSAFWGRHERGFVIETGCGPNQSGKLLETWRNDYCGSLNVAFLGLHLIVDSGQAVVAA